MLFVDCIHSLSVIFYFIFLRVLIRLLKYFLVFIKYSSIEEVLYGKDFLVNNRELKEDCSQSKNYSNIQPTKNVDFLSSEVWDQFNNKENIPIKRHIS